MSSESIKAALIANLSVAVAKSVGAFFTGSASMAAEAIHSFADSGNQLLLFWGIKSSKRRATTDHPLGFGKNVYFWSFVVALVLFWLGGAYSIKHAVDQFGSPEPLEHLGWAALVLFIGFIAEARSLKICIDEIKREYPEQSLWHFFKHTRNPGLLIIFAEDSAALFGLLISSICIALAAVTNDPIWDIVGSFITGVILCIVSIFLFIETKALLIGQSIEPSERKALHALLASLDQIEHTYQCITLQNGDDWVLLLRVRMKEQENAIKLIDDINDVERAISENFPHFIQIFVEPDNNITDF